jgi:O-antigen ligase
MKYSDIVFALFIATPRFKGDPRIAHLLPPFDLTLLFGIIVYCAVVLRMRRYDWSLFPGMAWLYLPFNILMITSIFYSPLPYAGAEKALRFILVTELAVITPFFVLDTPSRMRNFFITLLVLNFLGTLEPLSHMGDPITDDGDGRLTVVGGTTIELGTSAVLGISIILFLLLPQLSKGASLTWYYLKKLMLYLMIVVFFTALIGAGARSATIALVAAVLLNAFFYRQQRLGLMFVACLVAFSLPFIEIPEHSLEYLGSLIHSDANSLLNWRGHLMLLGLALIKEYPLLGVGLGGYPFYGTVPPHAPWFEYNWPHNVIIEIGCEMGLPAAIIASLLIILSFVEVLRQLVNPDFPYKVYSRMCLTFLTIGFLEIMNTGDINNARNMWLYMSLPFAVRCFGQQSVSRVAGKNSLTKTSEYLHFSHPKHR